MIVLYNRMAEREAQRMKFDAVIHGINLDEIPTESESVEEKEKEKKAMRSFVFKDPKAYEGMTQEEKEAETKEMMGFFKSQVEGTPMVKAEKARVKVKRKAAEQKNG